MGSGVILLVIVGMWAIVLVPTLLRRHDAVSESRSVDRFSAAMRILSRRTSDAPGQREIVMPPRPANARRPVVTPAIDTSGGRWRLTRIANTDGRAGADAPAPARPAAAAGRERDPRARGTVVVSGSVADRVGARPGAARGRASLAVRRRRLLLGLLASTFVTACLALASGGLWWGVFTCLGVLLVADVLHLRVEARRSLELARRRRQAARRAAVAVDGGIAGGVPYGAADRQAGEMAADLPTAAGADLAAAQEFDPDSWDPVNFPLPTYVTKPPAPQRVVDVTAPGEWTSGLLDDDAPARVDLTGDASGDDELDAIIDRRRAVGD